MDFLTDARLPERAARRVRRDAGGAMGLACRARPGSSAGAEQWAQRLAAAAGRPARRGRRRGPPHWVAERIADAGRLARFIADLTRSARATIPAGAVVGAARLPCTALLGAVRPGRRARSSRRCAGSSGSPRSKTRSSSSASSTSCGARSRRCAPRTCSRASPGRSRAAASTWSP